VVFRFSEFVHWLELPGAHLASGVIACRRRFGCVFSFGGCLSDLDMRGVFRELICDN